MVSYLEFEKPVAELEKRGELVRITTEVDPKLEMTEIAVVNIANRRANQRANR